MNIAILLNHMNRGGLASYVTDCAKGLEKKGHNIFVLSGGGELENAVNHTRIDISGKNAFSPRNLLLANKLNQFIKQNSITHLWAHTRITSVMAGLASAKANVPLITTAHGFYRKNIGRALFPCWGKKTIAISNAVKQHIVKDLGAKPENTEVIYNAINEDKINLLRAKIKQSKEIARNRIGINNNEFIFGMLARISYAKGHEIALKAFAQSNAMDNSRLLLAGKGSPREEANMQKLIKELNIQNKILWIREIEDTALFWASVNILLVPSISEGLGLSPIEAQLLKVPVIASDAGGLKEVVIDNQTGRSFDSGNIKQLSKLMDRAMTNYNEYTELAQKAEAIAKEKFNYNTFIEKIENILSNAG